LYKNKALIPFHCRSSICIHP